MAELIGSKNKNQVNAVSVSIMKREIKMHPISEDELHNLVEGGNVNALNQTFLGISVGAFISLLATVLTAVFSESWTHASFVLCTWLAGAATIYFGIRVCLDRRSLKGKIESITRSPVVMGIGGSSIG